ncbi:MAG: hypothetical protein JJT94_00770, partial [Bernardetiaceae bacterium]|nr:hypothetical protein [Bernardetiaceae bacterium]
MDKDLLQKHQNDPAWAEVIRLYSGLFDTQDEREDFIIDFADKDILLAAECKTSSVEEEENIESVLIEKANNISSLFQSDFSSQGLLSLLHLQSYENVINILSSVRIPKKKEYLTVKKLLNKLTNEELIYFWNLSTKVNNNFCYSIILEYLLLTPISNDDLSLNSKRYINSIFEYTLERATNGKSLLFFKDVFNYDVNTIINKCIKKNTHKSLKVAKYLIEECNLLDVFAMDIIINSLISQPDIHRLKTVREIL